MFHCYDKFERVNLALKYDSKVVFLQVIAPMLTYVEPVGMTPVIPENVQQRRNAEAEEYLAR